MATLLFSPPPPPAGPILTAIRANNIIKDDDGSKSSDFLSLFPECKTNPLRALCFKYRRLKKWRRNSKQPLSAPCDFTPITHVAEPGNFMQFFVPIRKFANQNIRVKFLCSHVCVRMCVSPPISIVLVLLFVRCVTHVGE
jgi:hypothetical protein